MTYEELSSLASFLDAAFWRSRELYLEADYEAALVHCRQLREAGEVVSAYMFR